MDLILITVLYNKIKKLRIKKTLFNSRVANDSEIIQPDSILLRVWSYTRSSFVTNWELHFRLESSVDLPTLLPTQVSIPLVLLGVESGIQTMFPVVNVIFAEFGDVC
jgi:hypothetical protein